MGRFIKWKRERAGDVTWWDVFMLTLFLLTVTLVVLTEMGYIDP